MKARIMALNLLVIIGMFVLNGCSSKTDQMGSVNTQNKNSFSSALTPTIGVDTNNQNVLKNLPQASAAPTANPVVSPITAQIPVSKANPDVKTEEKDSLGISSNNGQQSVKTSDPVASTASSPSQKPTSNNRRGGTNGRNYQEPDLSGEVVSVTTTQITLKVIKPPEFTGRNSEGNSSTLHSTPNSTSHTNYQPEYTGETKSVNVPDGLVIKTFIRGSNGREEKDIKVSDLQPKQIVQIWFSDKQSQTVSQISVRQQRQ